MLNRNNILKWLLYTTFVMYASCSSVHNTTSDRYYKEIMNSEGSERVDLSRSQAILNFVEIFRTAYNRKDVDLLAKVFSDDALISNFEKGAKQTKKKYIKYLHSVFERDANINVKLENIEIVRHPKFPDIYGVRFRQVWNTTTYSNVGFVFLIVDFKDGENIQILQHTWQPEKLNGEPLTKEGKFKSGNFDVKDE